MKKPDVHIVAFAVPYPPHYGGAIDVWNRVKALHAEGLNISLHCFMYGPFHPHDAIQEVVSEVNYYPRITWQAMLAPGLPYIVSSRRNQLLLNKLKEDNAPILFEGIHTTGYCDELKGRKHLLRSHNIEHRYYNELAKDSQRFRYLFFQRESLALHRYECNIATHFDTVFTISPLDHQWYESREARSVMLPVFHGFTKVDVKEGRGEYILYQGDLSIESNQQAILEIIRILSKANEYKLVVAGRPGDANFEEKLTKYPKLQREADVSESRMTELVRDAHVIIVHSRHAAGMKVKLFPSLYYGRHVVANEASLTHTPIDAALHVYRNAEELTRLLKDIFTQSFTKEDHAARERIVALLPDDGAKAKEIIRYL